MKRLEFHITYICNHHCIFCSEDDRMILYNKNPLTEIQVKTILLDRRKKGFNHVNFTGGEPTLFPNFLGLLRFAKKLGYKIYVGTNGTMFASEDFAKDALGSIDELSFSIHWYDEESCYEQTKNKQHFEVYKLAVKNIVLHKANQRFFSNIVLNKYNFQDCDKILHFIVDSGFPVEQVLFSNIAPEGLADHHFDDLVFDLQLFQKYIPSLVRYCKEKSITLRFFGLPTCILGEAFKEYANDAHWEERHTIERFTSKNGKVSLVDIYSPDNSRKRCFVEKCSSCTFKNNPCTGVFTKYLDYYTLE